jgi:hypothetical protein
LDTLFDFGQINPIDIEAVQLDLVQNGFDTTDEAIFSTLGLSPEAIDSLLENLLAVNPAEAPANLTVGLGQLAENYGEFATLTADEGVPDTVIPELPSLFLIGSGLLGLAGWRRHHRDRTD